MSRFIIFLSLIFLGMSSGALAQMSQLMQRLDGIEKLDDIMTIVQDHYDAIEEGRRERVDEPKFKHWVRWAYYMSARTDEEGRIVDVNARIRRAWDNYSSTQRTSVGTWAFLGPSVINDGNNSALGIGRVDRIAFHPTNASIMYIGTPAGGLLKTTNGGSSWIPLTDNLPSVGISGVVVSHDNPNKIFILTGDGDSNMNGFVQNAGYMRTSAGVFVSYDGGINWFPTSPLPISNAYVGYALVQDPNNANILIAATSAGIYRSTNSGGTWTQVLSGRTFELKFRPSSSDIVYATQSGAFLRSSDGGQTWNQVTNFDFTPPSGRIALAVTNALANRVYLLSGWGGGSNFGGLYISYNSGLSFTRQCNSPNIVESGCDGNGGNNQSVYDLAIGASHGNASFLVTGGVRTWRSEDAGVTMINAYPSCDESSSTGYVHADIHDLEYNPLNGYVFACTDGGVVRSRNHGEDWTSLSNYVVASQIYHMAGTPDDLDNLMIGLQDNGVKRRNTTGTAWDQVLSADGFDNVYFNATTGYGSWNQTVYFFWNNGGSRNDLDQIVSEWLPSVTVHNTDVNTAFAGFSDVYKTDDGGSTWSNEGAAGNWDIERCPSNNARFYAAGGNSVFSTSGQLYRSDDTGDSWTTISGNPGYPSTTMRLTDVDPRPTNSLNVWITFGGFSDGEKVYFSSNGGSSWTNMSGSLPNVPVNAIAVDNGNNVYIGTDIGVFYRGASMSDWVPFMHDLPITPVTDLVLYPDDGIIRAATFGRGVWQSGTYSVCPTSQVITTNQTGHKYYEVSDWIWMNSAIYGGSNTDIVLKAANSVTLSTGFQIGAHNKLHVYTAPCGVAEIEE